VTATATRVLVLLGCPVFLVFVQPLVGNSSLAIDQRKLDRASVSVLRDLLRMRGNEQLPGSHAARPLRLPERARMREVLAGTTERR